MDQSKMKIAYVVTQRGTNKYWTRIGVAFVNKDGSINVKLDALPTGGTLQIRDYEPREEGEDVNGLVPPRTQRGLGTRAASDQAV